MGKPYRLELDSLSATYETALQSDIGPITQFLRECRSLPLLTVGSGGSFTAAHFIAALHERYFGSFARPATPLDAVEAMGNVRDAGVLLLSAGGSNPDVLGAFRLLAESEPASLAFVCGQRDTSLHKRAAKYPYAHSLTATTPSGKDGFLATNSLLMTSVLLLRAYAATAGTPMSLPPTLGGLVHPGVGEAQFVERLARSCHPLWSRPHLIVLHGPETASAAVDLESKFTEAALGTVQVADLRNFAHGRHHWLAKRGEQSSVLTLVTERDHLLASATLKLLPPGIVRSLSIVPGHGPAASIAAMAMALHITGDAGIARGIDPGRPGVPAFGRRIYHLRTFHLRRSSSAQTPAMKATAIERKAGIGLDTLRAQGRIAHWQNAYRRFVSRLHRTSFSALVLDYDGTLCDTRTRASGLPADIAAELVRVARAGIRVGVVTGRGQSVRRDLQNALPADVWPQVTIGYYSGSDIASMERADHPRTGNPNGSLGRIAHRLGKDAACTALLDADARPSQISIRPKTGIAFPMVWDTLCSVIAGDRDTTMVRSGHSIDVLGPGVSKTRLVDLLRTRQGNILCIGDRGRWPGNDFALLTTACSLSAHEVSSDPDSCWNLAPPGQRGVSATLYYLRSMELGRKPGSFLLRLKGHEAKRKT